MKTLLLLRHAKSSWDSPSLSDFERPLNSRGLKTAPFMGEVMRKYELKPEIIVSSPAERAKQTAMLVKDAAQLDCELEFNEGIYGASPYRVLEIISELNNDKQTAMLVGHNPTFEHLTKMLSGEFQTMPTAALAVIDLNINHWNEIEENCGSLRKFIRPKDEM